MVACALLWGAYPLVAKAAGYDGARASLFLMLAGLVPVVGLSLLEGDLGWPDRPALFRLVIAGLMMGVGLVAFVRVATGTIEASVAIPIVDGSMLLVSAVGAVLLFGDVVTVKKVVGIAFMIAGMGLLRPS